MVEIVALGALKAATFLYDPSDNNMDVISTPKMEDMGPEEPLEEEINEQTYLVLDTLEPVSSTKKAIISLHTLLGVSTL